MSGQATATWAGDEERRLALAVVSASTSPRSSSPRAPVAEVAVCRICWGENELDSSEWTLVSPCSCTGTMKHIHLGCLQHWQATQRAQGYFRRALECDICKAKYTIPAEHQHLFAKHTVLGIPVPSVRQSWNTLRTTAALRLWLKAVYFGAMVEAGKMGLRGGVVGFNLGMRSVRRKAAGWGLYAPRFVLMRGVPPLLQLPTSFLLEVALSSVLGAYVGIWAGSICGAANMGVWTVKTFCDCAGMAAGGLKALLWGSLLLACRGAPWRR